MNAVIILIVVIIIILIYILYIYFYSNVTTITNYLDLNNKTLPIIPSENLIKPKSETYSYSFWLFIAQPNQTVDFIYRVNEIKIGLANGDMVLKLLDTKDTPASITIYKSVPSQKWIHVIINRTSNLLECYINGKLYITQNVNYNSNHNEYGRLEFKQCNAYITNFQRWYSPISSQEANQMYYKGNGKWSILPNINVSAALLQNNVVKKQYNLF